MTLSDLLVKYRTEHNISQRQFASQCGVSNGYIAMLENNRNPKTGQPVVPSLPYLNKIASCMGITLSELFSMVDDMPVDISLADQWSVKFRESLQKLLVLSDETDTRNTGINIDRWNDIAYGFSPLSLETCCNFCAESGKSLDNMVGLNGKNDRCSGGFISREAQKIAAAYEMATAKEKKMVWLALSDYLGEQIQQVRIAALSNDGSSVDFSGADPDAEMSGDFKEGPAIP